MLAEVTLRTGRTVPEPVSRVMPVVLRNLMNSEPVIFYELVMLCRDPQHQLWSDGIRDNLTRRNLLEPNGQPHSLTRDMVLACVEGEDLDMRIVSPI